LDKDRHKKADECFSKGTDIHDHASGLSQIFEMVIEGLVKDNEDKKIAKLVSFIFINFPDYVGMDDEGVLELKNVDPSVPLLDDTALENVQFDSLELVEKCHLMTFMLSTVIWDIVRSGNENKLTEVGNKIHEYCKEALANIKERDTPSTEDLDELWKE